MGLIMNLVEVVGFLFFALFGISSFRLEGSKKSESLMYSIISLLIAIFAAVIN